MTPQQRAGLRKTLRQKRRQLTPRQQGEAASRLFNRMAGQRFFRSASRIAFYLPNDGELDPSLLLAEALQRGQHCYLPVIHPMRRNRLLFVRFHDGDTLVANRWGILEPRLRSCNLVAARALDLVLVPLVGFDACCNRLGMGKGFYDRTFSFLKTTQRQRPILVGIAHECQRVLDLESESWDVRLDRIESDQTTYRSTSA